jgi:hypothetical protein
MNNILFLGGDIAEEALKKARSSLARQAKGV